jgi:flavin reductase (DIM6/NTAB) family NADH-FMN oxidoreductase RutF
MLSMAIKKGRDVADWLTDGVPFTVNILAEGQKELLSHFGKGLSIADLPNVEDRVLRPIGGAPVLKEALAALHCKVIGRYPAGDHHLILGQIVAGSLHSEARPHVHIRKSGLNY